MPSLYKLFLGLRSVTFYILLVLSLLVISVIAIPVGAFLPFEKRFKLIISWNHIVLWLAKYICGINYKVHGSLPQPAGPMVVMCKHQSAWETIFLQILFAPIATILKRELLNVPFFGWGMAMLNPIAIERNSPHEAMQQVQEQGLERLGDGYPVLIFPEGTRTRHGAVGRYAKGGATLAKAAKVPILPIAHNAGKFWPKGLIKYPGTVHIVIGELLDGSAAEPIPLTSTVRDWIEATIKDIDAGKYDVPA